MQDQVNYRLYTSKHKLEQHYKKSEIGLQYLNQQTERSQQLYDALRIVSWNMHGFQETRDIPDYEQQLQYFLEHVKPDVLVIIEHNMRAPHQLLSNYLPYYHMHACMAVYSRIPFRYVNDLTLDHSGNRKMVHYRFTRSSVNLYITHLSPYSQNCREESIRRIMNYHKELGSVNTILVGDFNHVDIREMPDKVKYLAELNDRTGILYRNVIEDLEPTFMETFNAIGAQPPYSTHWTGTRIDYIFVTKAADIMPIGSYVYHSILSDHLPIISDFISLKSLEH